MKEVCTDFEHVMPSWRGIAGQKFGKYQPQPIAKTKVV
jgi:hypothetical protein